MNILITGGASGLGESVTRLLAGNNNHFVYFTYCNSKDRALQIEKEFKNVKAIYCDFAKQSSVDELTSQMYSWNLSALINNALSGHTVQHFHKIEQQHLSGSFHTNILPAVMITQKAVLCFRKQKFGKIITILSSALVNKPPIGWSGYVAEKAYLHSLCKSIAVENAGFNITSNCISPSFMLTDLHKDTDERVLEEMEAKHPLKKLLSTQEVSEIVGFVLNATQHLNGVNIVVNAAGDIVN